MKTNDTVLIILIPSVHVNVTNTNWKQLLRKPAGPHSPDGISKIINVVLSGGGRGVFGITLVMDCTVRGSRNLANWVWGW